MHRLFMSATRPSTAADTCVSGSFSSLFFSHNWCVCYRILILCTASPCLPQDPLQQQTQLAALFSHSFFTQFVCVVGFLYCALPLHVCHKTLNSSIQICSPFVPLCIPHCSCVYCRIFRLCAASSCQPQGPQQ